MVDIDERDEYPTTNSKINESEYDDNTSSYLTEKLMGSKDDSFMMSAPLKTESSIQGNGELSIVKKAAKLK